ncbi:hypothetical protein EDC01DRAFT_96872 [Geopyxis carbonaria]|nr:hypothetical protein EDC01DRAFT_96872 [Geopyxis carbonaria]
MGFGYAIAKIKTVDGKIGNEVRGRRWIKSNSTKNTALVEGFGGCHSALLSFPDCVTGCYCLLLFIILLLWFPGLLGVWIGCSCFLLVLGLTRRKKLPLLQLFDINRSFWSYEAQKKHQKIISLLWILCFLLGVCSLERKDFLFWGWDLVCYLNHSSLRTFLGCHWSFQDLLMPFEV